MLFSLLFGNPFWTIEVEERTLFTTRGEQKIRHARVLLAPIFSVSSIDHQLDLTLQEIRFYPQLHDIMGNFPKIYSLQWMQNSIPNFVSSPTNQMSHQATMTTKPIHYVIISMFNSNIHSILLFSCILVIIKLFQF